MKIMDIWDRARSGIAKANEADQKHGAPMTPVTIGLIAQLPARSAGISERR